MIIPYYQRVGRCASQKMLSMCYQTPPCQHFAKLQQPHSFSSTSSTERPFQILGLQQVAVGSTDLESLRYLWMDIFGLKKVGTHTSERENVVEDILVIGPDDKSENDKTYHSGHGDHSHCDQNTCSHIIPVELDLMCPIDENKSPKV